MLSYSERPPRGYVCLHWREGDADGCCERCLRELETEEPMNEKPENPPAFPPDELNSNPAFYRDPAEQLAFELAWELEEADLDREDLVKINHEKLLAISKRILIRSDAMLAARQKGAQ